MGALTYRLDRPIPGKLYVCELGGAEIACRLAGPYDTLPQAIAAAGAIEAEFPEYSARTEIWQCPQPESDSEPIFLSFAQGGFTASPLPLV